MTCDLQYRYRFEVGDIVLRKGDVDRHRYTIREFRGDLAHIGMLVHVSELEPLEFNKRRMERWDGQNWMPVPVYA